MFKNVSQWKKKTPWSLFSFFFSFPSLLSCPRPDHGTWSLLAIARPWHWNSELKQLTFLLQSPGIVCPMTVRPEVRGASAFWWPSKDGPEIERSTAIWGYTTGNTYRWGRLRACPKNSWTFGPLVIVFGNAWYFEMEKLKGRNKKPTCWILGCTFAHHRMLLCKCVQIVCDREGISD